MSEKIIKGSKEEQLAFVSKIASQVVEGATLVNGALLREEIEESCDAAHNYTRVLCHYSALTMEFVDAWAEGDGVRMYRCYRLLLPHFFASHCTKYALEALRLQFQVETFLSPKSAHHVKWDRFVNTHGGLGRNIPLDLHNEHVNKLLKQAIAHMGPNLNESTLQCVARSISAVEATCKSFDDVSGVPVTTNAHSTKGDDLDVEKVMRVVMDNRLFEKIAGHKHSHFPTIKTNPLWNWDCKGMRDWVCKKKNDLLKFCAAGEEEELEQPDSDSSDDQDDYD